MTTHDSLSNTNRARAKRYGVLAVITLLGAAAMLGAAMKPVPRGVPLDASPARPPIVGVAHIGLKVSNIDATRQFYGHVLGFDEPFHTDAPDGSLSHTYFKVNDRQYIEIFPNLKAPDDDRLSHIAFETTDSPALRDYLASKGIKVPERVKPGHDGNLNFTITDPDGHRVEFVQYMPGSQHSSDFGKNMPATRVSDHIQHVGITVKDRDAADKFYKDVLGFRVGWHGGRTDNSTDWVDMVVPEGHDWVEYMLNVNNPTPRQLGVMHHFSLRVPDAKAGGKTVAERGYKAGDPKVGRDGKRQLNLYDPDLTRVEMMEPKPVETPCCSIIPEFQ